MFRSGEQAAGSEAEKGEGNGSANASVPRGETIPVRTEVAVNCKVGLEGEISC